MLVNWLGSFKERHRLKYIRRKICLWGFSSTLETAKNLDFCSRKRGGGGGNYLQIETTEQPIFSALLISTALHGISVPSFQMTCASPGVEEDGNRAGKWGWEGLPASTHNLRSGPAGTTWDTRTAEHPAEILSPPQQLQEADPGDPGLQGTLANLAFLADPWYTSWHSHTAELFRFISKRVRTSCIVHSKF